MPLIETYREVIIERQVDGVGGAIQVVVKSVVIRGGSVPQNEQQRRPAMASIPAVQGGQQALEGAEASRLPTFALSLYQLTSLTVHHSPLVSPTTLQ